MDDDRDVNEQRMRDFFAALTPDALDEALDDARRFERARRDTVYRILHQSFKVYHFATFGLGALEAMLSPLGFRSGSDEDLVAELERWAIADEVVVAARKLVTLSKRDPLSKPFAAEDIDAMASGYMVATEVAVASLEAMKRMIDGTGFLWNDEPMLDTTDALFLESWTFMGQLLRYGRAEDVKKWTEEARARAGTSRNADATPARRERGRRDA